MKRSSLSLLLLTVAGQAAASSAAGGDTIAHTFFSVRPHFQTASPERVMFFRNDKVDERENKWGGAFQAVVYGGKSINSCRLAEFFMPFGKTALNVYEFDQTLTDPTGGDLNPAKDIEARNFNIQTVNSTFHSIIEFSPEQEFIGVGIDYMQRLWKCGDHARLWLEVSLPIERIRNRMGLTERVVDNGGGAVAANGLDGAPRVGNMIAAFNQSNWNYGKIAAGTCMTEWGVADVEVKLHWNGHYGESCRLDSFLGFVAPTGSKINACHAGYVFSPVVGNNHRWGFLFGGQIQFNLWECGKHSISSAYDLAGRIFLKNHQIRSFDLEDKQWGRYLEVYTRAQAEAEFIAANPDLGTSGINVFTRKVKVDPRYAADSNTAFIYRYCGLMVELGYNLYVREAERICPACPDEPGVAIKSVLGDGALDEARTIRGNFVGAAEPFTASNFDLMQVTLSDFDLNSASHPATISNTIYGGIGYEWTTCSVPMFFGFGGSYEFSRVNTTLERWMAFGKFGLSF